jgi:hypothetical protein
MKKNDNQAEFIEKYNSLYNVPNNKANKVICDKYKKEHSNEFKKSGWSIEKHRKKFMDWMSGNNFKA